ncbi:oxidoreductase [Kaistia dalseonensis]|uniref:NAD(P)-dependent dehydrogenase (Short-subunit alcohol dehydrogenase family) n=1 Tax=Kaistia dalseonensis TaxID=410840 RepID=A0ABU0HAX2_9HYPH|nr:oxidoreductase [Kaistia dalseonensis]MCX5496515.1 oxidoreductase [Kaistia dalseonensis]MDQ0439137.1 NAD(P)-dependent dehydrogenase (short-subunit alcohol dehydrogenase family) [Kaistia dalseonensis]
MNTPQHPIGSGFSAHSTTLDVIRGIDLTGKLAIVTGGYAGLGLETARTLASAGARVIVPARNVDRARLAVAEIGGGIEVRPMDLTVPASIDAFARGVVQSGLPLHILVNSAGIMALPELTRDSRGHEMQFSTNHLGHFQLVAGLWPALKRAGGARVVSVSSLGHLFSDIAWDDINYEARAYDAWSAYGQSKTANALFAVELDRRGREHGVRAFSLHPGGIVTGLARHLSTQQLQAAGNLDQAGEPVIDPDRDMKSVPQGAATQLWCAVSPQLDGKGGVFCANADIAEVLDGGVSFALEGMGARRIGVAPYAVDPQSAERLWSVSEAMTGATL